MEGTRMGHNLPARPGPTVTSTPMPWPARGGAANLRSVRMLRGFRRGEQPPAGEPEAEEPAAPPTDEGPATPPEADGLTAPFQAPLDDLAVAPSEPALAVPTEPAPAAEPPRTGRRTRRGWSLRAHLVTLVAIALALLVVAGVALTLRDYRVARDDTAGFGHYTSRLAAAELTATIPDIRGLMIRS